MKQPPVPISLNGEVCNTSSVSAKSQPEPQARRNPKSSILKRKRGDSVSSESPIARKKKAGTAEDLDIIAESAPSWTLSSAQIAASPGSAVEKRVYSHAEPHIAINPTSDTSYRPPTINPAGIERFRSIVHINDTELKHGITYVHAVNFFKTYDGPLPFSNEDYVALRKHGRALQDGATELPPLPAHLRKYAGEKLYIKRVSKHDEIHYGGTDMQENNRLLAALGASTVGNETKCEDEYLYQSNRPMAAEEEDKDPLNGPVRRVGGVRLVFVGELLYIMHVLVYGARFMEDTRMNLCMYEGLPKQFVDEWMAHCLHAGLYYKEKRFPVPSLYSNEVASKKHAEWVARRAEREAATEAILARIDARFS
ncbi:hypothetical protein CYLTODRAFT_455188 [Cylindrobasidium torrendii FP15055 ss-10]|uniref:Uncharacterized protein n=1 Tax=Cylindrobasidium torrendii FP15055 ss-10 TaxID=1314674 RepID=A0A0D7BAU1_9AGAR|nr:hypothetical protein CYLTODRAFT_455188 [Cylindrobasidium torrendii FP15055 ss-10]